MYKNRGTKMKDPFMLIFSIFAIVGIAMILMSIIIYGIGAKTMDGADTVMATITGIETYKKPGETDIIHIPSVRYKVDGKVYNRNLDFWDSSMKEGQSIEVEYQKENPYEIRYAKGETAMTVVVVLIGGIFATVGVSGVLHSRKKRQERLRLLEHGTILEGKIRGVMVDLSISVNGRHPYYVVATVLNPVTQDIIEARSEYYKVDITPYVGVGETIKIYCDLEKNTGAIRDVQFKDCGRPMVYEAGQLNYKR